ncbi:MAG: hypothetical protein J5I53_00085 [Bradyrhizobiaceae bacterium]|nr:hypothetical protein [Bradyrhizobiaceae bacterium]
MRHTRQANDAVASPVLVIGLIIVGLQVTGELLQHRSAVDLSATLLIVEVDSLGQRSVVAPEKAFICGALLGAVLDSNTCFFHPQVVRLQYDGLQCCMQWSQKISLHTLPGLGGGRRDDDTQLLEAL